MSKHATRIAELLPGLSAAHVGEYFGVWAIHEEQFRAAVDRVRGINLAEHVAAQQAAAAAAKEPRAAVELYQPTKAAGGAVAVIDLRGPMMKQVSSLSGGTSTVAARRQIRHAAADNEVGSILLRIDSPGGTVAGTMDLAQEVAAAAKRKRVEAYIEDMGASAAYWIASQASKVWANDTALVGSIGTYAVLYDLSELAKTEGIKVHVVRAGEFKGMGEPGTEISEKHLAEVQRIVNELNSHFLAGVQAGRRMKAERVKELADGRVHIGQAAVTEGLIDGVQSFDAVLAALAGGGSGSKGRAKAMSEENTDKGPRAATIGELKAACPGASADFLMQQLEAGATEPQAMKAWMGEQAKQLAAAKEAEAKLKADADAKAKADADAAAKSGGAKKPGVKALAEGKAKADADAEASGDPIAEFNEAVDAKVAKGRPKAQAIAAVAREKPELHRAYVIAHNEQHGRRKGAAAFAERGE